MLAKRFTEMGLKIEVRGWRIHIIPNGPNATTRRQEEEIVKVVDTYGARVHFGKIVVTKPRGKAPRRISK